eukprot:gene34617-41920_t
MKRSSVDEVEVENGVMRIKRLKVSEQAPDSLAQPRGTGATSDDSGAGNMEHNEASSHEQGDYSVVNRLLRSLHLLRVQRKSQAQQSSATESSNAH